MFKKLRNKFLILNLLIISVMMLLSFGSIYLIIYQNVRSTIYEELADASEFYGKMDGNFNSQDLILKSPHRKKEDRLNELYERSISFSILTDKQYNAISKSSTFKIDDSLYEDSLKKIMQQNKTVGNFKSKGYNWAFAVIPLNIGYRIVVIDITSQQQILNSMVYTFIFVALIMLIIIYFISRFFANRAIKPVKDAFEKQQQFISDASHELKTPLTVINTSVDVLLSNGTDTISSQSKWLSYIKSECERMSKLTNDLLYLTQMDCSSNNLIFSNFNISEVVENVILTMEAIIFEQNISLSHDIEPYLITHGNSDQIREVVMILLDNAVKYTNKSGSIYISLKKCANNVLLSITNTGKGIPEEDLERVFDRFYRTDKSRSRSSGGYGLGLAIAKAIVTQHKGKIYVKSTLDKETSFYVELPFIRL
ncbi:His Kinase A (phospho-acceptor) domain-containing protein [Caloramator quimbayensis]|uniref:histidine kinase n=1 Tax=Caloramator quimbayensis TaxID=1147123 RepID=A0A1T4XQ11_9CLOT|nr:HAMP domain-containing sensor histidine kinase [Caloramator quimbayensis]SKA91617.1 His Kinase A (phospho-acceptor) domain-containing protein [Caloramator quimbayensis]